MSHQLDYAEQKHILKQNLERLGVSNENVREAIFTVPREAFVPQNQKAKAYVDSPLPIGEEQTISQPSLVAFMTQELDITRQSRVLEIGTGCGYQTALLAELAGEVYTIEVRENLAIGAQKCLKELGYTNIQFRIGNGRLGWPEAAPFDRIIVTAGAEGVPVELLNQLRLDGKLIIPITEADGQRLKVFHKTQSGLEEKDLWPVRFVPLVN